MHADDLPSLQIYDLGGAPSDDLFMANDDDNAEDFFFAENPEHQQNPEVSADKTDDQTDKEKRLALQRNSQMLKRQNQSLLRGNILSMQNTQKPLHL
jgi:hypothetical protein